MKRNNNKIVKPKRDFYDDSYDTGMYQPEKKRLKPTKRIRKQDIDRFDDEY